MVDRPPQPRASRASAGDDDRGAAAPAGRRGRLRRLAALTLALVALAAIYLILYHADPSPFSGVAGPRVEAQGPYPGGSSLVSGKLVLLSAFLGALALLVATAWPRGAGGARRRPARILLAVGVLGLVPLGWRLGAIVWGFGKAILVVGLLAVVGFVVVRWLSRRAAD